MREIKFRAWLEGKHDNMTISNPVMEYDVTLQNGAWCNVESGWDILGVYPTVPIMQFTGLKDMNGKEIYEGDIVKWDDQSNGKHWRLAVVEINPDIVFNCKRIKEVDGIKNSAYGTTFRFGAFIYTDTHNHLHIIGNIYDNPELLEETK